MDMESCDCIHPTRRDCLAEHPQTRSDGSPAAPLKCTRPSGHTGSHVACGGVGNHRLLTWTAPSKDTRP